MTPQLIHRGGPLSIEELKKLLRSSYHGGEIAEGAVYRVERHYKPKPEKPTPPPQVLFLAKYVFSETEPGKYMKQDVWTLVSQRFI